jgi:hypothetical protein
MQNMQKHNIQTREGNIHARLFGGAVVVLVVIGGLIAGLFAGSIQRALMVPVVMAVNTPQAVSSTQAMPTTTAVMPVTGMQMLAEDTFKRADGLNWGTASDNRMWEGDANHSPVFSIIGNTGHIADGTGTFNALLGPNKDNVDVLLQGSVNHFASKGQSNLGVVLRWSDANNWYKALIDNANLTILKRANGQGAVLSSVPFKPQDNTPYSLRFRAVGATLYAKAWPSNMPEPTNWMLTATDTALPAGQAGVRVLVQSDTVMKITLFQATAASATTI